MIPTPPTLAGLFFCLASAEGARLLFCPAIIQPHTSVYKGLYSVYATIPPTQQNSTQGFAGAFPAICRALPLPCGGCIQLYRTACVTLERIHAPGRPAADTRYQRHARNAVQVNTAALLSYYNNVYKGGSIPQTMPARRGLDASHARRLAIWHRVSPAPSTRRGSPAAGVRRAARNHWRLPPYLFSGFRPIANKGEQ